ncbi:hypothetical protein STEG23_023470 [Scotinomys teguina]
MKKKKKEEEEEEDEEEEEEEEECVLHQLNLENELLLSKKLNIKKSNLERFLEECDTVAPWFAVSGSLTVSSWEKLGCDLHFAAEQATLKSRVRPIWKLVCSCLDEQRCHEALENGQAALEIFQEERSEKATSKRENKDRKRKQGLYLDLTEFRYSDEGEGGSESSDEMDFIIEQLRTIDLHKREGGGGDKKKGSNKPPDCCDVPTPHPHGTGGAGHTFNPDAWKMVRVEMPLAYPIFQEPQGPEIP